MSNGDSLMAEWDEFKRFERFQETQPKPEPKPKPKLVNPHLAYSQGPAGQTTIDWKAFSRGYTPEQLEIHSTVEDKRDIRDPEQVWNEIAAARNGGNAV